MTDQIYSYISFIVKSIPDVEIDFKSTMSNIDYQSSSYRLHTYWYIQISDHILANIVKNDFIKNQIQRNIDIYYIQVTNSVTNAKYLEKLSTKKQTLIMHSRKYFEGIFKCFACDFCRRSWIFAWTKSGFVETWIKSP